MENKTESILSPGAFPRRITLELTNRCNLSCTFCPRRLMKGVQGFMDEGIAKKILDQMSDHLPVALVPFFRGESLLHPEWKAILAYAKKKGIGPIQFTTNATLMDTNAVNAILDLQLDFISFSMDTIDPQLYERTRLGANYEKVLKNILFLLEEKEKRGLKLPEVQVSAVHTPVHSAGMGSFMNFWKSKVDKVRIYVEHSHDEHLGKVAAPLPEFTSRLPCHKVFTDMVVYFDGEVAICNHDWTRDSGIRIGDVRNEEIATIWQSERYNSIRDAHKSGFLEQDPLCHSCDHWKANYLPEGYLGNVFSRDF